MGPLRKGPAIATRYSSDAVGRRVLFCEIVVGVHGVYCLPEAESSETLDDVPDRFAGVMDALVDRHAVNN